jgi:O-antigen/teichoic acid export membrane protein
MQPEPTAAGDRAWAKPLRRAWHILSGHHVLALADQAVVSATNFLALIMLGRWSDTSQLGAYVLGYSILALLLATQASLITRPYAIRLYQPEGSPAEHAFSALALSTILSATAVLGMSALAAALYATPAHDKAEIVWALAGATPFVLLREFARKSSFAHFRLARVLLLDLAVALLNIGLLGWLAWSGRLSAASAFAMVALSCGIGAIAWLYVSRREFYIQRVRIMPTLKRSWSVGKWLFCSQVTGQVQGYAVHWLTMAISGAVATGIYAACVSIVSLANPLLFGMVNLLTPRSVRALRERGTAGLRRQAVVDALLLAILIVPLVVFVTLFGEDLMRVLYAGPEFQGNGPVLALLSLAMLASAVGTPASIALASAERGHVIAFLTLGMAVFSICLISILMMRWGLLGAAFGLLSAEVLGSIGFWLAFLALVPDLRKPELPLPRSNPSSMLSRT